MVSLVAISYYTHNYLTQEVIFYTSYYCIDESATVISIKRSKLEAIKFLQTFYDDNPPVMIELNAALREKSYSLFKQTKSKNISVVDCYSAILMRDNQIKKCLTFDKHFKKLGFEIYT